MLKAYRFIETPHVRLHEFVVAFFDRIEHESGEFNEEFFDEEFLPIVNRHHQILRAQFENIYEEVREWPQADRSILCEQIRQSNQIERICRREVVPQTIDKHQKDIYETLRNLFLKLYSNVLDGDIFRDEMGVILREHFDEFRKVNHDLTVCPMCGISELKTEHDDFRDQYDHYLPKSVYAYSSVNFLNLVPTCKDCNSFDVKGDADVLDVTGTRKLFFPYDENHQGVDIDISIAVDDADLSDIEWKLDLASPDGKDEEVESWGIIYNIETRYKAFVKGRIKKWYKAYWEFMGRGDLAHLEEDDRRACYLASLEEDEKQLLSFVKRPALMAFLEQSPLARAAQEAAAYS